MSRRKADAPEAGTTQYSGSPALVAVAKRSGLSWPGCVPRSYAGDVAADELVRECGNVS